MLEQESFDYFKYIYNQQEQDVEEVNRPVAGIDRPVNESYPYDEEPGDYAQSVLDEMIALREFMSGMENENIPNSVESEVYPTANCIRSTDLSNGFHELEVVEYDDVDLIPVKIVVNEEGIKEMVPLEELSGDELETVEGYTTSYAGGYQRFNLFLTQDSLGFALYWEGDQRTTHFSSEACYPYSETEADNMVYPNGDSNGEAWRYSYVENVDPMEYEEPTSTPTPEPTATPTSTSTPDPRPTARPKPQSTPTPTPTPEDDNYEQHLPLISG